MVRYLEETMGTKKMTGVVEYSRNGSALKSNAHKKTFIFSPLLEFYFTREYKLQFVNFKTIFKTLT